MLNFCSLYSGSSGNSLFVETENTKVLVDVGLSCKKIEEALKSIKVDPSSINAILVTHEHADHIKGLATISKKFDIPVFATRETFDAMPLQTEKISSKNIHAYIMGEHGDSSFVPWDHAYVGCKKVKDVMKDNNHPMEDLEKIHKGVVDAAYEIIEKKKATYYGIGMALSRLVKAVLDNENSILTVSTYLKDGQYGQDDIYIGVPAIINSNGVRELVELNLNETEQAKLNNSCKLIKEMRERSIEKIIKG